MVMDTPYFSDREKGLRPRIEEDISETARGGIYTLIKSRIADGSFGYRYPSQCQEGQGICGCDENLFWEAVKGEIPDFTFDNSDTFAILDLIQFCHRVIAYPEQIYYHQFWNHHHLRFDPWHGQERGQSLFREDVNRILARNGLVYELSEKGQIIRLAPSILRESLASAEFRTGDNELDSLLENARVKFLDPDIKVRQESLEKLWDAWERLKTIEEGKDKKDSISKLLDKAASKLKFREALKEEAGKLTGYGNTFRIRHSETNQESLERSEHVDYLFHRLFAMITLLLKSRGRV